jgi:hypothetical protein
MERIEPSQLASVILNAPCWVRLGIAAPTERIRERAAQELADAICSGLDSPATSDRRQLPLPL